MNSPQFAGRNLAALVSRAAGEQRSAEEVAQHLFLTILSRRPTAADQALLRDQLSRDEPLHSTFRELAWTLLMSSEFSLNH
jgi:hypothetical protein